MKFTFVLAFIFSISFNLLAGVTVKKLNEKLHRKWIQPQLKEVIQSYQNLLIKVSPELKEAMSFVPLDQSLFNQYRAAIKNCTEQSFSLESCSKSSQHFKKLIAPYYRYWENKMNESSSDTEKELLSPLVIKLKHFYNIRFLSIKSSMQFSNAPQEDILRVYTLPYPYLLTKLKNNDDKDNDIKQLWGNMIEPIISNMFHIYSQAYIESHINGINLQINETRMLWTKRNIASKSLQRSINYMHNQWNRMLKLILKF